MNILVVGNGWLGNIIKDYFDCDITPLRIKDISDVVIDPYDVVINTAAKTNIDWCEQNQDEAYASNTRDAVALEELCHKQKTKYVFISSACIFQSNSITDVKVESSTPDPQCYYAQTKRLAEENFMNDNTLVIRIRLPISKTPHSRNSLSKILSYSKLVNSQESMTVIEDMLPALQTLIYSDARGVYHLVNEGTISPSEIADMFDHPHEVLSKEEFDKMIFDAGRCKRVSTIVNSERTRLLPNISKRILEIKEKGFV